MYNLDFIRASSVREAKQIVTADEEAKFLSGGQTLLPTIKQRLAAPTKLVSLSKVDDMTGGRTEPGSLTIGAATTHAAVARQVAKTYPALAFLAGHIGDPAVRNRGTLGGSLANNDPSACYPAATLASGATIITDTREIAADDYFQGLFTTALEIDEIITAVRFPLPISANYQKFTQPASRFALVGVFVAQFADHVRVAVTGASQDGVFRWHEAEAALRQDFDPDVITSLRVEPADMIADIFAPAGYRAHLIPVLTRRAVQAARADLAAKCGGGGAK